MLNRFEKVFTSSTWQISVPYSAVALAIEEISYALVLRLSLCFLNIPRNAAALALAFFSRYCKCNGVDLAARE
jgi:hypothetical protein